MPMTDREIERRLDRSESDILELYGMVRDIQRTVKSHDVRFDGVDGRLDRIDGRLGGIDGRLDNLDGRLGAIDGRLDSINAALAEVLHRLPEN